MKRVIGPKGGVLTQMEKGETLNPNGRPPVSRTRATIAKAILERPVVLPESKMKVLRRYFPDLSPNMTAEEAMTYSMFIKTMTNSPERAYEGLQDSGYGKPTQTFQGNTPPPTDIIVRFEE